MNYTVTISNLSQLQASFKRAPQITSRAVATAVNKSLVDLQRVAKEKAPVDTGFLRGSIQMRPASAAGSTIEGSVSTNALYAGIQEGGSGIYGPRKTPITPKIKQALVFRTKDGRWIRTKSVRGVKGKFYMKGSIDANQHRIDGYFAAAGDEIAKELAV